MFFFIVYIFFVRGEVQSYLNSNSDYPGRLVGSWTTLYGDVDQAGT